VESARLFFAHSMTYRDVGALSGVVGLPPLELVASAAGRGGGGRARRIVVDVGLVLTQFQGRVGTSEKK